MTAVKRVERWHTGAFASLRLRVFLFLLDSW
jgi:hypothetical protein